MLKFAHDIAGGQGNLIAESVQSPNFRLSPFTGWKITRTGDLFAANATISGTITASVFKGTDFQIDSSGELFYSGVPAAGDLFTAISPAGGTDQFGNTFLDGIQVGAIGSSSGSYTHINGSGFTFRNVHNAGGGLFPSTTVVMAGDPSTDIVTITATPGGGGTGILRFAGSMEFTGSPQVDTSVVLTAQGSSPSAPPSGSTLYSDSSGIARVINQDGQAYPLGTRLVQNTAGTAISTGGAYTEVISSGTLGIGTYRLRGQVSYKTSVSSPTGSPRVRFDAGTATQGHARGSFTNGNAAPVVIDKGLTSSDTFPGNALTASEQLMAFDFVLPVTAAGTFTVICASTGSSYTVNFVNLDITPA